MGDSLSGVTHVAKYLPKEAIQTVLIDSADNEKHGKSNEQNQKKKDLEEKDKVELSEEALQTKILQKNKKVTQNIKNSNDTETNHFDVKI